MRTLKDLVTQVNQLESTKVKVGVLRPVQQPELQSTVNSRNTTESTQRSSTDKRPQQVSQQFHKSGEKKLFVISETRKVMFRMNVGHG